MGWLRLDDQFDDHPKTVAAGHEASWLDVRGMLFCARHETNGEIPDAQLPRIGSDFSPAKRKKLIAALLEVGRWERTEGGYLVHDFLEYNPTSAQKEAEREAARERMRVARQNKGKRSGARSGEQQQNEHTNNGRSSHNPDPAPPLPGSSPQTPRQAGGLRANGENPRAQAAKREQERLLELIENCSDCGDNPNRLCGICTGLNRKLAEVGS